MAPTAAAWLADRRRELARICRYAIEEHHARARGEVRLAEEIAAWVNQRADRFLEDLGAPRTPRPMLIGTE